MSLRVKRYTLKYGGTLYRAGETVEMPDAEARRLAQANPAEFEYIKPVSAASASAAKKTAKKAAAETTAEGLPAADLSKTVKGK